MSIDVFGRTLKNKSGSPAKSPPGIWYKITDDGDYDVDYKRLCHVAEAKEPLDAVNLTTLQMQFEKLSQAIENIDKKLFEKLSQAIENIDKKLINLEKKYGERKTTVSQRAPQASSTQLST